MRELELEKTFLAKALPPELDKTRFDDLLDVYIPATAHHPVLRIRKKGGKLEITKKQPAKDGDASEQYEHTIPLTPAEFEALSKIEGKRLHKHRYYCNWNGTMAEVDVFQDDLAGLVLVDFEFSSPEEKAAFETPEFCLTDVTQEDFVAGGMLCGKKYSDIEPELKKFGYAKIP
ncbi:MAG: hypothetical protein AB1626_03020 [Candidatus Micrarchaeota archaeon]